MHAVKPLSQKPKDRKLSSTRQCGSVRIEIEPVERCDADALVAQIRAQHEVDHKSSFSRGLKIMRRGISMSMLRLRANSGSFTPSTAATAASTPSIASICTEDTPPLTPDVSSFPAYSPCSTPSFVSSPALSLQSSELEFHKSRPQECCGVRDYVTAGTLSYLKEGEKRLAHPLHGLGLYLEKNCGTNGGTRPEYLPGFDVSVAVQHESRAQASQLRDSSPNLREDTRVSYSDMGTPGESIGSVSLHDLRSDFPSPPDRAAMAINGWDTAGAHFHHAYRNAFNRRALQTQNLPAFHLNEVSEMSTIACRRKANGSNGESSHAAYMNDSSPLQDAKRTFVSTESFQLSTRRPSLLPPFRSPAPHCVHPPEMTCLVEGGCSNMRFKSVGGPRRSSEVKLLGLPNGAQPRNPSMRRSRSSPALRKPSKLSSPSPLPMMEAAGSQLGLSSRMRCERPAQMTPASALPSVSRDEAQRKTSAPLPSRADGLQRQLWEASLTDPDLSWEDILALQAGGKIHTPARTHLLATDRQKTSLDALITNFSRPLSERTTYLSQAHDYQPSCKHNPIHIPNL